MRYRLSRMIKAGGGFGLFILAISLTYTAPANAESSLLFGQNQAYSAVVRSDGTVITYGKIYLENRDNTDTKTTVFYAPKGIDLQSLEVYQLTLPEHCQNESTKEIPADPYTPYPYIQRCDTREQQAFQFDNYGYYGESGAQYIYKKVAIKQTGNKYTLTLPDPIAPSKRGAYIVAFKTTDYTSSILGVSSLNFKTLPVDQSIEQVRVSIDLSTDLYTRTGQSSIRSNDTVNSIAEGATSAGDNAIKSNGLDELQGRIGQGGAIEKTGKGLTANESFVVTGQFADASWKLYLKEIAIGVVTLLLLTLLTLFLLRKANTAQQTKSIRKGVKHGK